MRKALVCIALFFAGLLSAFVVTSDSSAVRACRTVTTTVVSTVTQVVTTTVNGGSAPLWTGDFESGDLSQWDSTVTQGGGGTVNVVMSPVVQGSYAAHFVAPSYTADLSRIELDGKSIAYGTNSIVDFYFMVDSSTAIGTNGRFEIAQWHPYFDPCYGGGIRIQDDATIRFEFRGGKVLGTNGGCQYASDLIQVVPGTLIRDHWYHVHMAVRWNGDPSIGFVHVWLDGSEVIPLTYMGTASLGTDGASPRDFRFRQGIYRVLPFNGTTDVYADGMIVNKVP